LVALISDIHGNIHALDAVLADMPKEVDEVWVLGDMVGGLPFNNEVVEKIANLPKVSAILGNWEENILAALKDPKPWQSRQYATGIWTFEHLKPENLEFIKKLPSMLSFGDTLLYHGSPESATGTILSYEDATNTIAKAEETKKFLFGGHTHKSRLYKVGDVQLVGVGSVGLSFDEIVGVACYALFDGKTIAFRHVPYDMETALAQFRKSDLWEFSPYFSKSFAATMLTGKNYTMGFDNFVGLLPFAHNYAKEHSKDSNNELWEEGAKMWKIDDWLEELLK